MIGSNEIIDIINQALSNDELWHSMSLYILSSLLIYFICFLIENIPMGRS